MISDSSLIAGVMSGTSADGIDVAICRVERSDSPVWGDVLAYHNSSYTDAVRREIHEIRSLGACTLAELTSLTRRITIEHASAIHAALNLAKLRPLDLIAVGDHGQTLFHSPPHTLQIFDPALLAWDLGVQVVSDFRRADLAAGGQGAPLVPFADYRLFRDRTQTRAVVNLGGISNVTLLPAGCTTEKLKAFDMGPANCLSDHVCRTMEPAGPGFDPGGAAALLGEPDETVVTAFLRDDFFAKTGPKSTDGPAMVAAFERAGAMKLKFIDALATAAECVARSVTNAILRLEPTPDEVIASGGGIYNVRVINTIIRHLHDIPLRTTDELGIPSAAKEAIAFALLAAATLEGAPGNIPSCTGAARPVVLGAVTRAP